MTERLTIALSKGRILREALPLLARAGVVPVEEPGSSRRLILETRDPGVRLVVVRAADVPTYVAWGAADLGVAGKDVLDEHDGEGLYEPLDLEIARCRMMLAAPEGTPPPGRWRGGRPRVATKYPRATRRFFAARGLQVEIIKLYGSMELAPLAGLADYIVDLVDTGATLRANGLVALEPIAPISSRLVANKAAMKIKHALIKPFLRRMEAAVAAQRREREQSERQAEGARP